jgi:hypothetical protein
MSIARLLFLGIMLLVIILFVFGYYKYIEINQRITVLEHQALSIDKNRNHLTNDTPVEHYSTYQQAMPTMHASAPDMVQQQEQQAPEPTTDIDSVMEKNYLMQNPDSQIRQNYDNYSQHMVQPSENEEQKDECDETDEDESGVEAEDEEADNGSEEEDEEEEDEEEEDEEEAEDEEEEAGEAEDEEEDEEDDEAELVINNEELNEMEMKLEDDDISFEVGLSNKDMDNIESLNGESPDYEIKYKAMTVKELKEEFEILYSSKPKNNIKKNELIEQLLEHRNA